MKLLVVLGTRPEVIKLAPVIAEARRRLDRVEVTVCATGQHREMLQQALHAFGIEPDVRLEVMEAGQGLAQLTSRLLVGLSRAFEASQPDWVLVQGDTTSAFTAGLVTFYHQVRLGHVEAGLRTHDLHSPYPEEANRQLIGRLADLHFAPTRLAAENLLAEGVHRDRILITGNTVVDAVAAMVLRWRDGAPPLAPALAHALESGARVALVTCHRRESFGKPLVGICAAIRELAERYPERLWIFPVHLNPNVRDTVHRELQGVPNLLLTEPLDYAPNLYLLSRSDLAVTDSGGIQEEAASFAVPVVVMRRHTERQEGVRRGLAWLVGSRPSDIVEASREYLNQPGLRERLAEVGNPYGDGHASRRILDALLGEPVSPFDG